MWCYLYTVISQFCCCRKDFNGLRRIKTHAYTHTAMTTFFDDFEEWSDTEADDKPVTFEDAVEIVIGFGKYKGLSLGELARTSKGRSYLAWCVQHFENLFEKTRAAMVLILEEYEKAKAKRK
jgi:hypothetical protein